MLTSLARGFDRPDIGWFVLSWDLQTGGIISAIEWKGLRDTDEGHAHLTYLTDGKTVSILTRFQSSFTISIYDIVSGVYVYSIDCRPCINLDLTLGTSYVHKIWTHGESLRFMTPEETGITIWEVRSAPDAIPMEIETVSIPDGTVEKPASKPKGRGDIPAIEFHPASCRLALIRIEKKRTLLVWDARATKLLLHRTDTNFSDMMTFSSDARLFACATVEAGVLLWKESPTGYMLTETLTTVTPNSLPLLSPDGESIVALSAFKIQLWKTKNFITSTSSVLAHPLQHTGEDFVVEFLPGRSLAAVTRRGDETVVVLDLNSGLLRLTIDTPIEIYGLRQVGNTITVIGSGRAIAWDLQGCDLLLGARMDVEDSARTIIFCTTDVDDFISTFAASISLDFQYIALAGYDAGNEFLDIYRASTGWNVRGELDGSLPWFPPGGRDIWCVGQTEANVFTISSDTLDHTKTIVDFENGAWGCPWGSSRGYRVTDEGWILGAEKKRLLMLPPLWQSRSRLDRVWNEKFLALLQGELPEVVILELEP